MNRQEALEWLVDNLASWPLVIGDDAFVDDWYWWDDGKSAAIVFATFSEWDDCIEPITKADWLAATDNMTTKMEE